MLPGGLFVFSDEKRFGPRVRHNGVSTLCGSFLDLAFQRRQGFVVHIPFL